MNKLTSPNSNLQLISKINSFLTILDNQYIQTSKNKTSQIEEIISKLGENKHQQLKNKYENESLNDLVTNRREIDKIITDENNLVQKENPIYCSTQNVRFLDSHFYAPNKHIFGIKLDTFWANLAVLWLMSGFFVFLLYIDWLKNTLNYFNHFTKKISGK